MKVYNDHNVYIVGAGFSRNKGVPIVRNFLDVMRNASEYFEHLGEKEIVQQMNDVFEFRHKSAGAAYRTNLNIEDIEQLFSLASAQNANRLDKSIIESISATIDYATMVGETEKIKLFVEKAKLNKIPTFHSLGSSREFSNLDFELGNVSRYDLMHLLMLNLFEKPTELKNNAIISFNYDLVIEESLKALNIPFHYGVKRTHFSDSGYCDITNGFSLLKLHGSINWTRGRRGQSLNIHSSYKEAKESKLTKILLPPTWQKTFHGPFQQVWSAAIDEIKKATRLIVLGFSLPETDIHFKYLLSAGLSDNISLREIFFVNPEPPETYRPKLEKVFQHNFLRDKYVKHISSTIEMAFSSEQFLKDINRNSASYVYS
jgi:hypothetical protein